MDNFGCWEQSHTIKSDGFGMRDERSGPKSSLLVCSSQLWCGGGESKTGSQVQVDAHKKEAKCQYKEGRMMVPGHFMTDTGAC